MFGSCFTSCLVEGACLNYVNFVCVCVHSGVTTKSRDSVFVLDILKCLKILKITKNSEKILNITENSEHILKILKSAENCEQILNITENSEQILNIILLLKSIYFTSFSLDFN